MSILCLCFCFIGLLSCVLGGSAGDDNPEFSSSEASQTIELVFLDSAGNPIETSGELNVFARNHNPITDSVSLLSIEFSDDSTVHFESKDIAVAADGSDTVTLVLSSDDDLALSYTTIVLSDSNFKLNQNEKAAIQDDVSGDTVPVEVVLTTVTKYQQIVTLPIDSSDSLKADTTAWADTSEILNTYISLACSESLKVERYDRITDSDIQRHIAIHEQGGLSIWRVDSTVSILFDSIRTYIITNENSAYLDSLKNIIQAFLDNSPHCIIPPVAQDSLTHYLNQLGLFGDSQSLWLIFIASDEFGVEPKFDYTRSSNETSTSTTKYVYIPGTEYYSDFPDIEFDGIAPGVYPIIYADDQGNALWRSTIEILP